MTATLTNINGIDVDALKGLIGKVADDPARGIAGFEVKTSWKGGARTESNVRAWSFGGQALPRNFTLKTDEPRELCGEATAPNPQEVLMTGLNTCMMVGYVACSAAKGVTLESLSIESQGDLDLRGFLGLDENVKPGYDEIHLTVRLKGDGTPEQFQEIHETVQRTSPNFYNITHPIKVVPKLVVE